MRRTPLLLTAAMLVAAAVSPLHAQRGNASDVGGGPPTYPPGNPGRGNLPGNAPRSPRDLPPQAQPNRMLFGGGASVGGAASAAGTTVIPMAPMVARVGAQAAQVAVDAAGGAVSGTVLAEALLAAKGAPTATQVTRFTTQYIGMLNEPSARRIARAVSAFNALVDGAKPAYLLSPPAEFVAVQVVLQELVARTSAR